ncbi:hypothetical protein [Cohnella sp. JJ-181]|uniref:hypothetical protein n=1 Tax=Cohnella rhizoplanae TaxID=2974897 RepID=UPI0022FFB0AA|nr:hypothetical protein [Cohnella sp. JJ-181]CAI6082959.1 hypothetical protein COHCIP112018_03822 [Cohnella sp. JJ-181]
MNKKIIVPIIGAVFLLGNAAGIFAASQYQAVKAYLFPALKVELNGQEAAPVKALNYEGTLYLPAKSLLSYYGLNDAFEYDKKNNTLKMGGPMYLHLHQRFSPHMYQVVINGNWRPSILTETRKLYSNYYMGVDFSLVSAVNTDLDAYAKQALNDQFKYLDLGKARAVRIGGADALLYDTASNDSIGRLAIIQSGEDFVTIEFFVDKTRHTAADLKEFDKILDSFNIQ